MSGGRPSTYTAEIAEAILDRLCTGESLRSICAVEGMPSEAAVRNWSMLDRDGFRSRYEEARTHQAHALLDEILDTARSEKDAAVGRMRVDALKWAAARILPKVYSERATIEHTASVSLESLVMASFRDGGGAETIDQKTWPLTFALPAPVEDEVPDAGV